MAVHPCPAASSQKRRSSAGSSANATALSGGQCRASDRRAASRSNAMSSVSLSTTALPLSIFAAPTSWHSIRRHLRAGDELAEAFPYLAVPPDELDLAQRMVV